MRYEVEFMAPARDQLRALPKDTRRLIGRKIDRAQTDLAGDVKKLKGFKNSTGFAPATTACFLNWKAP